MGRQTIGMAWLSHSAVKCKEVEDSTKYSEVMSTFFIEEGLLLFHCMFLAIRIELLILLKMLHGIHNILLL